MSFPDRLPEPQGPSFERPDRPPFLDTSLQYARGEYARQDLTLWLPDASGPGFAAAEVVPLIREQGVDSYPATGYFDNLQNLFDLGQRYKNLFSALGIHSRFVQGERGPGHAIVESTFPSVDEIATQLHNLEPPFEITPLHAAECTPAELMRIFALYGNLSMPTQGIQSYIYLTSRLPAWLSLTPHTLEDFRQRVHTVVQPEKPIHTHAMGHAFLTHVTIMSLGAAISGLDFNNKTRIFREGLGIASDEKLERLANTPAMRLRFLDDLALQRSL